MNCSQCNQPLDEGATFCGNCGTPIAASVGVAATASPPAPNVQAPVANAAPPPTPVAQPQPAPVQPPGGQMGGVFGPPTGSVPAYAVPKPGAQKGENRAVVGLVLAILGLPGAIIPILGLILGITGVVLGSLSLKVKKTVAVLSLVFGILAILVSLGLWIWAIMEISKEGPNLSSKLKTVETPCYSVDLSEDLIVDNLEGSCALTATDNESATLAKVAYVIEPGYIEGVNEGNFASQAKNEGVPAALKGSSIGGEEFKLQSESSTSFAGKSAYLASAKSDGTNATSFDLVFVYNNSSTSYNVFSVVHAVQGSGADVMKLADNFHWK